jgi:hypothetical protein
VCPDCREAASSFARNLEWLKEAHSDPVAPAHYAAVRARVLGDLERGPQPWWRRIWICGAAAATVAMAFLLFPRPVEPPKPVGQPFQAAAALPGGVAEAPAPVLSKKPSGPGFKKLARARRRTVVRQMIEPGRPGGLPHQEPLIVKLLTDDPNVIIYWISEGKGE